MKWLKTTEIDEFGKIVTTKSGKFSIVKSYGHRNNSKFQLLVDGFFVGLFDSLKYAQERAEYENSMK